MQASDAGDLPEEGGSEEPSDRSQSEPDILAGDPRDGETDLPLDQVFEILKNSRRRETIRYLKEQGGSATLSEVAEHIAALENDTTVQAITSTQRKRVYVGLYQCHLPKMDDMNVIDFDKNRGTIELSDNIDQLEAYLDHSGESEWYKAYLGIALGGAVLFGISQLGVPGGGLSSSLILLGMVGATLTCALFQAAGSKSTERLRSFFRR